jgi:ANTAR domain
VLDKNDDVGGTWHDNTYPGCRVDVPSLAYSHSFGLHYPWDHWFAPQEENNRYLQWCVDTFGVRDRMRFSTEVTDGQIIGALNLFRTETGSMSDDDVVVAQALADIATIAILQNRKTVETGELNAQLTTALSSRIVIEQAKGMVAERQSIPVDEAFDRLRRHARNHNLRLADVACDTVDGTIDPSTFNP